MNRDHHSDKVAEAVAQQIEPVYCVKCGSRLQIRTVKRTGFDKKTGYPRYEVRLRCPTVVLYETRITRRLSFTWRERFPGHTTHKVSKVIEMAPNDGDTQHKRGDAPSRTVESMNYCPDCGTQVAEDTRFCPECGHQVVLRQDAKGISKRRVAGIIVGSVLGIILIAVLAAQFSSPDTVPLPPPEPGWVRLQIPDIGSIDYPPDFLELQSGNYREVLEEFYIVYELQLSDFTLQQVGLNELKPSALAKYRRVMFKTLYLSSGEEVFRANEKYTMSQQELAEIHTIWASQASQELAELSTAGLGHNRIIDYGSVELVKVNGMFPLVWTYARQLNENPVVIVRQYMFCNHDKTHFLIFSHTVEDAEECTRVFESMLETFRLRA